MTPGMVRWFTLVRLSTSEWPGAFPHEDALMPPELLGPHRGQAQVCCVRPAIPGASCPQVLPMGALRNLGKLWLWGQVAARSLQLEPFRVCVCVCVCFISGQWSHLVVVSIQRPLQWHDDTN